MEDLKSLLDLGNEFFSSPPESSLEEPLRGPTKKEDLKSLLVLGDKYFGIEESFNPPVGFTYDQWRHKIVLEVEKSLGVQGKTWVDDDLPPEAMLKMDKVFEAVKRKLWELSKLHKTAWAPALINFSPAMEMSLNFLLGIIDQIKTDRDNNADFPTNPEQEYFNWRFFDPEKE